MKKYKAVIIDGKKLFKNSVIAVIAAGICGILAITASISSSSSLSVAELSPKNIINNVLPAAGAANNAYAKKVSEISGSISHIINFLLGFDPNTPSEILNTEIPILSAVNQSAVAKLAADYSSDSSYGTAAQAEAPDSDAVIPGDIPLENQAPIKAINLSPDRDEPAKIVISNETDYSIDINEMLSSPPAIDMSVDGPKVLVIHTHATEAYSPEGSTVYDTTKGDRSMDKENNVIKVGNAICEVLNNKGIETLHDTELHDYPSFNGSYAHSLAAIEAYLEKYPSIQVVFDVHRDSIVYSDNTKVKPLTQINGKSAAQLMLVVGTDQNGLYNPDWRERLKTAIHLQYVINQRYPTLMRHINLRKERFNGHATNGSMIIETGSSGNSLDEAIYGITLAADCIADYLSSLS